MRKRKCDSKILYQARLFFKVTERHSQDYRHSRATIQSSWQRVTVAGRLFGDEIHTSQRGIKIKNSRMQKI